jgi:hypothetical protein
MYQSNQARIEKEIPSLLLGRGQGPWPASSRPRCPSRCILGVNSTRGYCSSTGTVACRSPPLLASPPSTLAAT